MPRPISPPVRHGQGAWRSSRIGWAVLRGGLIVVGVLVASAVCLTAIFVDSLSQTITAHSVDLHQSATEAPPQPLSGAFTVLLVGADNSADQKGFGAARQATLNDVNILLHVNADHTSATVLSLPRDLVVDHPACTATDGSAVPADDDDPLNADLGRGGLGCVVTTVESVTGLRIPYAAEFSFEGTVEMADAVGGVPVCTTQAIDDPDSGLVLPKGRSVVSGRTALAYLRDRHGVGDGSDLARISSQQAYMSSLLRQAVSANTLTNPAKLLALATATAKDVSLSTSMARPDVLVGMMVALLQVPLKSVTFVQFPTSADPENPDKVVPDASLAAVLLQRIKADEPVVLAKGTTGYATEIESAAPSTASTEPASGKTSSASPTPTPTASTPASDKAISGLSGQTADEATCSVAASD